MFLRYLIVITFLISNSSYSSEVDLLSKDILEVLSHVVGKNSEGKERLELDKTQLLYELTKTGDRFDCMRFHDGYSEEKNEKLLSKVEHGSAKFELMYTKIDLSEFEIDFIQLKNSQSRVLIVKGELDGVPVYFRLEIGDDKKASVSYVKIQDEKVKEESKNITPIYQGKTIVGVSGTRDINETGSELNWEVNEDGGAAELIIKTDGEPDQISVGLKRKLNGDQEISGGIVKKTGALTTSISGKNNQDGLVQSEIKVETKAGPIDIEVKSNIKADSDPTHSGMFSVGKGDSSLSAGASLNKDSTNTIITAKTKLTGIDLSGEHSQKIESGEYQIKTGAGINLTEQQRLESNLTLTEKSKKAVGLNYTYTTKDSKVKFNAGAKVILAEKDDKAFETTISIDKQSKDGRDTITLSAQPILSSKGSIDSVKVGSNWDRKISSNANFGIYAKTTQSLNTELETNYDVGVRAKVEFGGPNKNIKVLRVYKLHEIKTVEKLDSKYKTASYLVWNYQCNLKKKKLTIKKPKKKFFGGYDLKNIPITAMPLEVIPEKEYTSPKGINKDSFCKF